ncbi:sugar phosphate isomerase/epimerase family protein [Agromyces sp. SYSU T00194]|uniref:sugar phosphate isomerase/epimerase family protein n=1 Tax=Agromyces chitinivorans TaxID=3158560 RepID=UPI003391BBD6
MRIGIDGRKIPRAAEYGPLRTLDHAVELGMDGVFFRTILDTTPNLDPGVLSEVRTHADELGLYLEAGLGKVNPYATPEAPELRRLGDGDIVLGFRRMIEAAASIDVTELWISTANAKPYPGRFATDRFRTDASWVDQLEATRKFLAKLGPIARDHGVHLNLETHEEITTFEVLRLIEATGDDVVGVVFDTANVLMRGEHPVRAAERIAPFVRQTHFKDAYVELVHGGALHESRACGEGLIDYNAILALLKPHRPDLNITFENDQPRSEAQRLYGLAAGTVEPHLIQLFDADWLAGHPDLTRDEYAEYIALVRDYTERIASGEIEGWRERRARPFEYDESVQWIRTATAHIEDAFERVGIERSEHVPA